MCQHENDSNSPQLRDRSEESVEFKYRLDVRVQSVQFGGKRQGVTGYRGERARELPSVDR